MDQRHVTAESLPDRTIPFLSMRPRAPGRKSTAAPGPLACQTPPEGRGHAIRPSQCRVAGARGLSAFPAAALPQPTKLDRRTRRQPQRCPRRDRPSTLPCLPIVGDPWEPSPQLNGSRKLAITVERSADRRHLFLGHSKHLRSMEVLAANGKLIIGGQPHRGPIKTVADARF